MELEIKDFYPGDPGQWGLVGEAREITIDGWCGRVLPVQQYDLGPGVLVFLPRIGVTDLDTEPVRG